MSGLTALALWKGEEEALQILARPGGGAVVVIRAELDAAVISSDGRVQGLLSAPGTFLSGAWSPLGDRLALGDTSGLVQVWSWPTLDLVLEWPLPVSWVAALAWDPWGEVLAAAAGKTLNWWSWIENRAWAPVVGLGSTLVDLDWPPEGPLAACGYGGVWLFSEPQQSPSRHLAWKGAALKVRWSPRQNYLATSDQDRSVHLWKWPEGSDSRMGTFTAISRALEWSPWGDYLATGGAEELVLWDFRAPNRGPRPLVGSGNRGVVTGIASRDHWVTVDDGGHRGRVERRLDGPLPGAALVPGGRRPVAGYRGVGHRRSVRGGSFLEVQPRAMILPRSIHR